jgi:hypothetical protein
VLASHELRELLARVLVVEEKVDGANLGFSVDEQGTLRVPDGRLDAQLIALFRTGPLLWPAS